MISTPLSLLDILVDTATRELSSLSVSHLNLPQSLHYRLKHCHRADALPPKPDLVFVALAAQRAVGVHDDAVFLAEGN